MLIINSMNLINRHFWTYLEVAVWSVPDLEDPIISEGSLGLISNPDLNLFYTEISLGP